MVLEVWKKALNNMPPSVEVKSRRVGGRYIPSSMESPTEERCALGISG